MKAKKGTTGQKLYQQNEKGIRFVSGRRPWEVRIPGYVYDLWMPVVGAEAIGVYSVYCRLERGAVYGITLDKLARACRIGKFSLMKINKMLVDCGFIRSTAPRGRERLMHWTTVIETLDPPMAVAQALIEKYGNPETYMALSSWLVEPGPEEEEAETPPPDEKMDKSKPPKEAPRKFQIELPEVPDRTSGSSIQNHDEVPDRTPNIETLGIETLVMIEGKARSARESVSGDPVSDQIAAPESPSEPEAAQEKNPRGDPMEYAIGWQDRHNLNPAQLVILNWNLPEYLQVYALEFCSVTKIVPLKSQKSLWIKGLVELHEATQSNPVVIERVWKDMDKAIQARCAAPSSLTKSVQSWMATKTSEPEAGNTDLDAYNKARGY